MTLSASAVPSKIRYTLRFAVKIRRMPKLWFDWRTILLGMRVDSRCKAWPPSRIILGFLGPFYFLGPCISLFATNRYRVDQIDYANKEVRGVTFSEAGQMDDNWYSTPLGPSTCGSSHPRIVEYMSLFVTYLNVSTLTITTKLDSVRALASPKHFSLIKRSNPHSPTAAESSQSVK